MARLGYFRNSDSAHTVSSSNCFSPDLQTDAVDFLHNLLMYVYLRTCVFLSTVLVFSPNVFDSYDTVANYRRSAISSQPKQDLAHYRTFLERRVSFGIYRAFEADLTLTVLPILAFCNIVIHGTRGGYFSSGNSTALCIERCAQFE